MINALIYNNYQSPVVYSINFSSTYYNVFTEQWLGSQSEYEFTIYHQYKN